MRTFAKRVLQATGALAIAAGVGLSSPAAAVVLFTIPIDGIATGTPGESILVTSVTVPDEFVGKTCQINGETDNQESVHPNNDLLIVTGGETVTIANFEREGFVELEAHQIEAISDTINVFLRFGPDGVSSGGFVLDLNCDIPQPTTTTTTQPPVATTAAPPTIAPTTVLPGTTDTSPDPLGPTATDSTTATTAAVAPSLPVTGSSSTSVIALVGLFILCGGYVLVDWARVRATLDR